MESMLESVSPWLLARPWTSSWHVEHAGPKSESLSARVRFPANRDLFAQKDHLHAEIDLQMVSAFSRIPGRRCAGVRCRRLRNVLSEKSHAGGTNARSTSLDRRHPPSEKTHVIPGSSSIRFC